MQERNGAMEMKIWQCQSAKKYMLIIREALVYFNIGAEKIRRMAEDNVGRFEPTDTFPVGNKPCLLLRELEK